MKSLYKLTSKLVLKYGVHVSVSFATALILNAGYRAFVPASMSLFILLLSTLVGASLFYHLDHKYKLAKKVRKAYDENPILKRLGKSVFLAVAWFLASIVVYQLAFSEASMSDEIKDFTESCWKFGSILITIGFFIESISSCIRTADIVSPVIRFFKRLIFLALLVSAVRFLGDEVVEMYNSEPMVLFQLSIGLLIVIYAMKLADGPKRIYVEHTPSRNEPVVATGIPVYLHSDRDFEHTCVHEAGHALVHALLDRTPENLIVSVNPRENGSLGRVQWWNNFEALKDPDHLLFSMRCDLAGVVAEEVVFGNALCGGVSDMRQWESSAKLYLSSGFGDFFYQLPTNELEVEANSHVLHRMKASQKEAVFDFLSENKETLTKLAAVLGDQKYLERDDIEPYLSRIRQKLNEKEKNL